MIIPETLEDGEPQIPETHVSTAAIWHHPDVNEVDGVHWDSEEDNNVHLESAKKGDVDLEAERDDNVHRESKKTGNVDTEADNKSKVEPE